MTCCESYKQVIIWAEHPVYLIYKQHILYTWAEEFTYRSRCWKNQGGKQFSKDYTCIFVQLRKIMHYHIKVTFLHVPFFWTEWNSRGRTILSKLKEYWHSKRASVTHFWFLFFSGNVSQWTQLCMRIIKLSWFAVSWLFYFICSLSLYTLI